MLKTAKLYSLVGIIVASTVIGVILPPNTAFADQFDATGFDDKRVLEDANRVIYAYVMSGCLDYTSKDNIHNTRARDGDNAPSQTDLVEGNWFINTQKNWQDKSSPRFDVGQAAANNTDGDGVVTCNDKNFNMGAYFTSLGGWQSRMEAACAVSFRIDKGGDETFEQCIDIDPADKEKKYNSKSISERGGDWNAAYNLVWLMPKGELNTGGYTYNPIQKYLLYKTALLSPKACGATLHGLVDGNPDNGNYDQISLINMEGEDNLVYINIPNNNEVVIAPGLPKTTEKCKDLPGLMQSLSGDYKSWLARSNPQAAYHTGALDSTIGNGSAANNSKCRVDGVGWIICPALNVMAAMVDSSYYLLDNSLLRVSPVIIGDTSNSLYKSWRLMRDFANVAFIFVFLIIILSQITSIGINNYGIKRLLPKLILSAILVNISYILCAFAVDASNVVGHSIKGIFDAGTESIVVTPGNVLGNKENSDFVGLSTLTSLTLVGVGLSASWYAVLPFLGFLLLSALGAVIITVVTLIIRQVLIILLIVIAPIAFVALLLPNTEDYFRKWRSLFQTLLLLYPIVAMVFGASALASAIIMGAAEAPPTTTEGIEKYFLEGAGGITQAFIQLTGAVAAIIPLFIVPTLMKLAGGVLNRFAGIVNDPSKGLIDKRKASLKDGMKIGKARGLEQQSRVLSNPNNNLLGNAGNRRRRFIGAISAYGANNRARGRKKDLEAAENTMETVFLGSERGQEAQNNVKRAQVNLQSAQLNAESVSINSLPSELLANLEATKAEKQTSESEATARGLNTLATRVGGADVWRRSKDAENRKSAAESNANALGLAAADRAAAAQAEEAKLIEKGNESNYIAQYTPLVAQAAKTYGAIADLNKQASEDTAAEITSRSLNSSVIGRDAIGRSANAKEMRKSEENNAAIIGIASLADATVAASKNSEINKNTAENTLAERSSNLASNASRAAEHESEIRKQIAEDTATTLTISHTPAALLARQKDAQLGKQIAENNSKINGLRGADADLKVQAAISSEQASAAENRDRQTFEELAAAGSAISVPGVAPTTADAAQQSRFDKKAIDSAQSNAAYEGEQAYASQIRNEAELRRSWSGIGPSPSPLLDQAGGRINPDAGRARSEDRAISVGSQATNTEVANAKARIESGDPTQTIERARDALIAANSYGDSVGARAAAQVLANKGSAGGRMLSDTIKSLENGVPQGGVIGTPIALRPVNIDVFQDLKSDLTGRKSIDSAVDMWATTADRLNDISADGSIISRLNEEELASQQMHVLEDALTAGTLAANENLIRRLIAQNDNGTIKLDTKKRNLLISALPLPPPPPPPPDSSFRADGV